MLEHTHRVNVNLKMCADFPCFPVPLENGPGGPVKISHGRPPEDYLIPEVARDYREGTLGRTQYVRAGGNQGARNRGEAGDRPLGPVFVF